MKMRITNNWLRRRIERDADLDTDAGLPITNVDVLKAFVPEKAPRAAPRPATAVASMTSQPGVLLGRLLRQLRRRDNVDLPRLAAEVRVPESELRALEEGGGGAPRPRTIHQLATFFKISPRALLALSREQEAADIRAQVARGLRELDSPGPPLFSTTRWMGELLQQS